MGNRKRVMVNYAELFAEKNKINSVLDDKLVKVSTLQESATDYITDDVLTGYAYSASKQYFNDIHIPMFGIFKDCVESLREANSKIETDYIAKVGFYHSRPMDTETLYNYIDKYNKNIASLRADRDSIQFKYYTNTFDGSDVMKQAAIDSINSQISANEAEIRELNDIITRLYDFNDTAFDFATAGTGLESAAFRINQFVELVDSLASFDLDKEKGREANLFCDYHWKERGDKYEIKDIIERAYKDVIRRRLRTHTGDINWDEASRIYTSGDELEKQILLSNLCREYNLTGDMSIDSVLLYISIVDSNIINNHFSDLIDEAGSFNFDLIEKKLTADSTELSDIDCAKLIAAFCTMDDNDKEKFIEISYVKDGGIDPRSLLEGPLEGPLGLTRVVEKYSLGDGFVKLWEKYDSLARTYQSIFEYDSLSPDDKDKYIDILQRGNVLDAVVYADQVWVQRPLGSSSSIVIGMIAEDKSYLDVSILSCENMTGINKKSKLITINGQLDQGTFGDLKNYAKWAMDPLARYDKNFNETQLLVVSLKDPQNMMALGGYSICYKDENGYGFKLAETSIEAGKNFIPLGDKLKAAKRTYQTAKGFGELYYDFMFTDSSSVEESFSYDMLSYEAKGRYVQGFIDLTNDTYEITHSAFSKEKLITNVAIYRAKKDPLRDVTDYYAKVKEELEFSTLQSLPDYEDYMSVMMGDND